MLTLQKKHATTKYKTLSNTIQHILQQIITQYGT